MKLQSCLGKSHFRATQHLQNDICFFLSPSQCFISINESDSFNEEISGCGFRATTSLHLIDQKWRKIVSVRGKIKYIGNLEIALNMHSLKISIFYDLYVMNCKGCKAINAVFSFCDQ